MLLLLLALACAPEAPPPVDRPGAGVPEAASAPHDLVASEEVLLHLTPTLPLLASDLVDGRLPGAAGRDAVAHRVEVVDLVGGSGTPTLALPRLGLGEVELAVDPAVQTRAREDLDLLAPLRARFSVVDHAKLKFVRGGFPGEDRATWWADTAIALTGTGTDGRLLSAHGSARTTWRWLDDGGGPRWKLVGFALEHMRLGSTAGPLFVETLDRRLPGAEALARARFNVHEQKIVAHIADRSVHPGLELESFDRHPGVAVGDVDGDGRDDLLATARWGRPLLLVAGADGTFTDQAAARGLDLADHCSAALLVDLDNDGDQDLVLGRTLAPSVLYENDGSGHFTDVSDRVAGGLSGLVSHLNAVDLDGDGRLDLYLSLYAASRIEKTWEWHQRDGLAGPYLEGLVPDADAAELGRLVRAGAYEHYLSRPGPLNVVLRNRGGLRFEAVEGAGVDALRPYRNTYATGFADIDGDGDLDAYLANDFSPNVLARNEGGFVFRDITAESGTADFGFGMGVGLGDFDDDGRVDIYASNMFSKAGTRITAALGGIDPRIPKAARGNSLFRNVDGTRFERASGLQPPAQQVEKGGWAWGGDFVDVDLDGRQDLFVLSGYYTAPWQVAKEHDC